MKLGYKVKCKGYLAKNKVQYVFANEERFKKAMHMDYDGSQDFGIVLSDYDDGEVTQELYKTKLCEFDGIIVGKKTIATKKFYSLQQEEVFDPITLGFIGERDFVCIEPFTFMDCYLVYYAMGKSRLVPIELVESK